MPFQRAIVILFVAGSCSLLLAAKKPAVPPPKIITYTKDVAPILFKNCVVCHRPNDIAPMSLMTYKDTRPWARLVRNAVVERRMPPWHSDPNVGEYLNDPRLSDADIATIDAWFRTGAREGDARDLPAAPMFAESWH